MRLGEMTMAKGVKPASLSQKIAPGKTDSKEWRKVRRVFGIALLIEALLTAFLWTLLNVALFWGSFPMMLFGAGGYLLLEPQAHGLLRLTLALLVATVFVLTWLMVVG